MNGVIVDEVWFDVTIPNEGFFPWTRPPDSGGNPRLPLPAGCGPGVP